MSEEDAAAVLKVDEGRFSGDGADLVLLQWLRQAEQAIETLPPVRPTPHPPYVRLTATGCTAGSITRPTCLLPQDISTRSQSHAPQTGSTDPTPHRPVHCEAASTGREPELVRFRSGLGQGSKRWWK